jgi:hypothetical protein
MFKCPLSRFYHNSRPNMHPQHKNNVAVSLRTAYGFVVTAKEPVLPFMFG